MLSITNYDKTFSFSHMVCEDFDITSLPLSSWEVLYQAQYRVDCQLLRRILAGTLAARRYTAIQRQWHSFRYYHGLFDSVSTFFVIVDVNLPTLCVLPPPRIHVNNGWEVQEPFRTSMCQQHEVTPNSSRFSSMHDFDYARLQEEKWGADTFMREKLNGSPLYRVNYESKKYMMGFGMAIEVSDDFPISVMEWTPEGMFILFPFAFPAYTVDGLQLHAHNWVSVDAVTASAYVHGAVFLINGVEYRSRRYPSVEVEASEWPGNNLGVWEKTAHAFLRPRPGRVPMTKTKAVSALSFAVPLACMELPVQRNNVIVRTTGPYQGSWGKDEKGPWFDSGVRVNDNVPIIAPYASEIKTSSAVLITDVYNIMTPQGHVISPFLTPQFKNVVTGAKVVLFDDVCNTYLIADEGKLLDLVGGRIEIGESSFDAMQREIKEETGLVLEPKLVGISSQYDANVEFHSYVYIAPCSCDVIKLPQLRLIDGFVFDSGKSVPWLNRLVEYVKYRCGGKSFGLKKLYASLDRARYRPKRVIYDKTFEHVVDTYTTHKTARKRDESKHNS